MVFSLHLVKNKHLKGTAMDANIKIFWSPTASLFDTVGICEKGEDSNIIQKKKKSKSHPKISMMMYQNKVNYLEIKRYE